MIYTLVGAPDTGKTEVAEKLKTFLNEGECTDCYYIDNFLDYDLFFPLGHGFLTDYREENFIAAFRGTRISDPNVIQLHSLIDSVGYLGLHVKDLLEEDINNPDMIRWSGVFHVALQMLIDSKQPDRILYLPYTGEEQNCIDLDEALQDILVTLELDYIEIDPTGEVTTWTTS